jgi:mono/diheme cytochrome c family protein
MRALCLIAIGLTLCACDDSMTRQNKYKTYAPSRLWKDGASARPLPLGVVSREEEARDAAARAPPAVTAALLERGQQRFDIFCTPCHGLTGEGDGIVVKRGFPPPPSYEVERLRQAPPQHFFDVITNGYGLMYSYAARVPPEDRWAIVAYVRALQLAGRTPIAMAPEAEEKLR